MFHWNHFAYSSQPVHRLNQLQSVTVSASSTTCASMESTSSESSMTPVSVPVIKIAGKLSSNRRTCFFLTILSSEKCDKRHYLYDKGRYHNGLWPRTSLTSGPPVFTRLLIQMYEVVVVLKSDFQILSHEETLHWCFTRCNFYNRWLVALLSSNNSTTGRSRVGMCLRGYQLSGEFSQLIHWTLECM